MNILLISGHGDNDSGAVGNGYNEEQLNIEFVELLKTYLDDYANVTLYDTSKNAFSDYKAGSFNVVGYDYVLEVHFNAFNGEAYGSEIYVTSLETGITVEQGIMEVLSKYFRLRDSDNVFDGVKVYNYSVIYSAKLQGVSSALLEVCFIDNESDMTIYQNNKINIISGVALAIINGFGLEKSDLKTIDELANEVIQGLWSNGEERKTLLEAAGYNYQEVQDKVNELLK